MTRWAQRLAVARWEFNRFVKWRQQLIGILVTLGVGGAAAGAGALVARARARSVDVAVVGSERLGFPLPDIMGVTWLPSRYATVEAAREAVRLDSVGGAVLVAAPGSAEVVIRKRAAWTEAVEPAFTLARRTTALATLPISPGQREELMLPFTAQLSTVTADGAPLARGARILAAIILGAGLLVLFTGFASLFAGISGEKQQRITEQMLSIVSPQVWMDGKILGLGAAALVSTAFLAVTGAVMARVFPLVTGGRGWTLPPVTSGFGTLALVALVTALGTAMWFAFMAAIAATIDDPNASPRASLLMVPMLPMALAFMLVSRADSAVAQALAIFPLTSMGVLPLRLLTTTVPWWEPVVAVLLLAATAWAFRRAAGKIFALGVLMYGKEPDLRELWRWAREA